MLERLVKNIGRKITTVAIAGTLLIGSGCATYNTINPSSIQPVTPIERPIERPKDYSKLTWQEAIEYVQTPEQVQDYLRNFRPTDEETKWRIPGFISTGHENRSFKYTHDLQNGNCFDYSTVSAALLSDNGFPPLLLTMTGESGSHTVFLYKSESGFGALGNSPLFPTYDSVDNLVRKGFSNVYGLSFNKFNIVNLNDSYPHQEWIDGEMDLVTNLPAP